MTSGFDGRGKTVSPSLARELDDGTVLLSIDKCHSKGI